MTLIYLVITKILIGVLFSKSRVFSNALWLTIFNGDQDLCAGMLVPALESRDRKRIYVSLPRRMRCSICQRSSVNRDVCEHEAAAIGAAWERG